MEDEAGRCSHPSCGGDSGKATAPCFCKGQEDPDLGDKLTHSGSKMSARGRCDVWCC